MIKMATKIGKTEKYINERLEEKGALLFMVVDPLDYDSVETAVNTGADAADSGADLILVGGSLGAQGLLLDGVTKGIKDASDVPVVLFPGNIATLSSHADAIYFMSMLNARNPYWITQAQTAAAPTIRSMGIEPLPVGYIVVSPGGTVGWIGDTNLVPREKPKIAASLALAGQYLGNRFIITDTGSNPQLQGQGPVPPEMIREVRKWTDVIYIVAGGIRTPEDARNCVKNGADAVQVGTAIEKSRNAKAVTRLLADAVKEEGARRGKA